MLDVPSSFGEDLTWETDRTATDCKLSVSHEKMVISLRLDALCMFRDFLVSPQPCDKFLGRETFASTLEADHLPGLVTTGVFVRPFRIPVRGARSRQAKVERPVTGRRCISTCSRRNARVLAVALLIDSRSNLQHSPPHHLQATYLSHCFGNKELDWWGLSRGKCRSHQVASEPNVPQQGRVAQPQEDPHVVI